MAYASDGLSRFTAIVSHIGGRDDLRLTSTIRYNHKYNIDIYMCFDQGYDIGQGCVISDTSIMSMEACTNVMLILYQHPIYHSLIGEEGEDQCSQLHVTDVNNRNIKFTFYPLHV